MKCYIAANNLDALLIKGFLDLIMFVACVNHVTVQQFRVVYVLLTVSRDRATVQNNLTVNSSSNLAAEKVFNSQKCLITLYILVR